MDSITMLLPPAPDNGGSLVVCSSLDSQRVLFTGERGKLLIVGRSHAPPPFGICDWVCVFSILCGLLGVTGIRFYHVIKPILNVFKLKALLNVCSKCS